MTNRKILLALEPILEINIYVKILCGISTLVVAFFAIRAYISKKRLDDVQLKIEKAKLARMEAEYLDKFKAQNNG